MTAYERARRALDNDLGLQPSEDLQRLSGEIVRQEAQLAVPGKTPKPPSEASSRPRRRRGLPTLLAAVIAIGAITFGTAWVVVGGCCVNPRCVAGGGGPGVMSNESLSATGAALPNAAVSV